MSNLIDFIGGGSGGLPGYPYNLNSVEITKSGTYIAPYTGVYYVVCCGAGGGGGGGGGGFSSSGSSYTGGAGGNGGSSGINVKLLKLTKGQKINVTIGAGGGGGAGGPAASAASGGAGGAGGITSFGNLLSMSGGGGGGGGPSAYYNGNGVGGSGANSDANSNILSVVFFNTNIKFSASVGNGGGVGGVTIGNNIFYGSGGSGGAGGAGSGSGQPAQIINNKVHGIFDYKILPEFDNTIVMIDVTNLNPIPSVGDTYNGTEFAKPIPP